MSAPDKDEILRRSCHFFSSEAWWKPIITFLSTKCKYFKDASPTLDEHSVYREFVKLVEKLVDETLCGELGISADTYEQVMAGLLNEGNAQASLIAETLKNASDFSTFRSQMQQHNARIDNLVTQVMVEYSQGHAATDPDKFAAAVAQLVQKREDEELAKLLETSCEQMRTVLSVDMLDAKIRKRPHKRPAVQKTDVNPSEIERRRQFWVRQRELLAKEEEKKGKPTYRHIIPH